MTRIRLSLEPDKAWNMSPLGLFAEGLLVHLDRYFRKAVKVCSSNPFGTRIDAAYALVTREVSDVLSLTV
jgi:hypothetical protein